MLEGYEYIKLIASLMIVILFLYAIYYYVNNYLKSPLSVGGGKEIEILERKMVAKNSFLILAKIKGRLFLLASDERGIHLLDKFEEMDES